MTNDLNFSDYLFHVDLILFYQIKELSTHTQNIIFIYFIVALHCSQTDAHAGL